MTKKRALISHVIVYAFLILIVLSISFMVYKYVSRTTKITPLSRDTPNVPPQQQAQQPLPPSYNPFSDSSKPQSQQQASNPFTDIGAVSDCSKENPTAQDACWQSKAIAEKNPAFCDSIKEANQFVSYDACINFVAHEKKDKSLCSRIKNVDIKKNCEDMMQ